LKGVASWARGARATTSSNATHTTATLVIDRLRIN